MEPTISFFFMDLNPGTHKIFKVIAKLISTPETHSYFLFTSVWKDDVFTQQPGTIETAHTSAIYVKDSTNPSGVKHWISRHTFGVLFPFKKVAILISPRSPLLLVKMQHTTASRQAGSL